MSTQIVKDTTFKCEGLSIFTVRQDRTVGAKDLRLYIKKHWKTIFQGMTNSTILIICGVHGSITGEVGDRVENKEGIKNQVGSSNVCFLLKTTFCSPYFSLVCSRSFGGT